MTKKLFLTLVSVVLMLLSCGGNGGSCTIAKSFGVRSLTKKDITQTCINEIAKAEFAACNWNYTDKEETAKHIAHLQTLAISFGRECKEKDKIVKCPDFIPGTLKLETLSGCEVYSIDPHTSCVAPCTDFYFSTGDDTFHTVYTGDEYGENPFIKSSEKIKEASFSSSLNPGSNKALFTWSEKAEDGTEIEKTVSVEMTVVDPNAAEEEEEPAPDTDIVPDEEIEVIDE